jgi:hypothetical protein
MSLKLVKGVINPRHSVVVIANENDTETARLTVRPVFFYKEKKKNFEDYNVPVYSELKLGTIICSNEFVSMEELHASFFEGSKWLITNVDYKMMIASASSPELYSLFSEMLKDVEKEFTNIVVLRNKEAYELLDLWPEEVTNALNVTANGLYKDIFLIIKKDSVENYKNEWWDNSQELMKYEKTT